MEPVRAGAVAIAAAIWHAIQVREVDLFSTASSTGKAGQITVSARIVSDLANIAMTADNGKISVATTGE